ncbi:hypothetical protein CBR_g38378 [Chara braunii]|uniref:Uncharacterized protein n=1 Tax=Chara braunii TaxID=69332 RepID=A0A388JNF1_CHABU|nr:hypothetical protein CBR_g38378 [Chara braunii]|eukprot:GBG59349.1 hypothetical protein CBR_g38378 [Chara braunii]
MASLSCAEPVTGMQLNDEGSLPGQFAVGASQDGSSAADRCQQFGKGICFLLSRSDQLGNLMDALVNQPIVIDSGSGVLKSGFAGDGAPRVSFPSFIGRPKHVRVMEGGEAADSDFFIGNQANELRGILRLQYPIEHGMVVDWDGMESIWAHLIHQELRIQPEEHPVLLTEVALNPVVDREKMGEIFFDKFNVPAVFFAMQPVLSLYAGGRTTGLVLESGDGVTQAVPVVEGFSMPHAVGRIDLAGRDISEYMQLLLRRAGRRFVTSAEFQTVRDVKEQMCFIPADVRAEVIFQPTLIGNECQSLHDLVISSIARADLDVRRVLYQTIVLSGGNTLFRGFGERLLKELRALAPRGTKLKIFAPPERQFSTWVGGSILTSLATFRNLWISSAEWQERGPSIVHNRAL